MGSSKKVSKPKKPAEHPKCSVMVTSAIVALKDRKGSSLAAIKKYVGANYKVDPVKIAPFIKSALKKGVVAGTVVQVKGKGAAGSFMIGKVEKPKKKVLKKKVKKPKKPKTPKKPKKAAVKKVKKSPAKKAAKNPAAKKPAAKKPAAKKPVAKKPAAKKPAA